MIKVGIIGAGAVSELYHLPVAQLCPELQVVALVDKNLDRAQALATHFSVPQVMSHYEHLFDRVDGVINALPHHLHASVTIDFLQRGMPVLVEKPMALNAQEAQTMVQAARASGALLQVGQKYRFCRGAHLVKQAINNHWLGVLRGFSLEYGFVYQWPVASGFFFDKQQSGGGVLIDTGSHILDLLLWWLGDVVQVEYRDDSLGGVEADCWLSLTLQSPTGPVQGTVTLSRSRQFDNVVRLVGEDMAIAYDLNSPDTVRVQPVAQDEPGLSFVSDFGCSPRQSWYDVYVKQLQAFAKSIATGGSSAVPGESVLGCVALIEQCYQQRQSLELPWLTSTVAPRQEAVEV